MNAAPMVYCFVDSETLLHYRDFDEVAWPQALGMPGVCLVLAPATERELARYAANGDEQQRDRVRHLLTILKSVLTVEALPGTLQPLRPGVYLMDLAKEPAVDWTALGLDPTNSHDRLLASALEFRSQNPTALVELLTEDFSLTRRAVAHEIGVRDPEGLLSRYVKVEVTTEEEGQQTPALGLGFVVNAGSSAEEFTESLQLNPEPPRKTQPSDNAAIEQIIRQEKQAVDTFLAAPELNNSPVRKDLNERYKRACYSYLEELSRALQLKASYDTGLRCAFQLVLENSGARPAENIEVTLNLPAGSYIIEPRNQSNPSSLWTLPKPPRPLVVGKFPSGRSFDIPFFDRASHQPYPVDGQPRPGPFYNNLDHSVLTYRYSKLDRQQRFSLPAFILYIPANLKDGFEIGYTLRGENLPAPVNGHLQLTFKSKEEETASADNDA